MNVTRKIEKCVGRMRAGAPFTYTEIGIDPSEYAAGAKAIERLLKKGTITRVSNGVFYKPRKTVFGTLLPSEDELLRPYLFDGNRRIGYITGAALYNKMGLTTQVPKNLRVASRGSRIVTRIGSIKVSPIKSYVEVTNTNYTLLEILDAIKDFKIIPDLDKNMVIRIFLGKIKLLSDLERNKMIRMALKYPPRVRAFLGALLNALEMNVNTIPLKRSINPFSKYNLGINEELLPTVSNWNIY